MNAKSTFVPPTTSNNWKTKHKTMLLQHYGNSSTYLLHAMSILNISQINEWKH